MYQFIVYGVPVTKKNSRPIYINKDNKRFIGKSKKLAEYETSCYVQLLEQKQELKIEHDIVFPISYRCAITYKVYLNSTRTRDCTNLVEAAQDALVKSSIISDDNFNILNPVTILVNVDKAINPHIQIDLIPYDDYVQNFANSISLLI